VPFRKAELLLDCAHGKPETFRTERGKAANRKPDFCATNQLKIRVAQRRQAGMPALRLTVASHIDHRQATAYKRNMSRDLISTFRFTLTLAGIIYFTASIGCRTYVKPAKNQVTNEVHQPSPMLIHYPEPDESVKALIKRLPIEQKHKPGLLRAWARITNNDHYRLARPGEFENAVLTHEYGEMAGASGLAALIVDKTLTGEGFSLVIFIERPDGRYDVYWVYRNMDLSKHRMSRASGDIFVSHVAEDGRDVTCEIQWDRKSGRWACTAL
jgi:hypothetical protein